MKPQQDPRKTSTREILALWVFKLLARLPLSISRFLGTCLARLGILLQVSMFRVTHENIRLCYPNLSIQRQNKLAAESFIETGKVAFETSAIWLRDYPWLRSKIKQVHNRHLVEEALGQGKGLIMVAPHLGNWEVLGPYLGGIAPITILYQPSEMQVFDRLMRESRERQGVKLAPTSRKGVAMLLKALKSGGFTGILPDQVPDRSSGGAFAPFFNIPALTMTLVHNLQKRSGCLLVAGYAARVPGGFDIHFVEVDPEAESQDEAEALAGLNRTVERCVNHIPAQYQWEYKRFRKQPDGKPKYYLR